MGQLNPPATIANFKAQFTRDFPYGPGVDKVRDSDIQSSLNMASSVFNPSLFSTAPVGVPPNLTSDAMISYLNLSAHFLVTSLQGVGGLGKIGLGISAQGEGVVSSKSVGGVSISFSWPSYVLDSPVLFQFTKTVYGQLYLQVLVTRMVGNVSAVLGEVTGTPNVPFF